MNLTYAQQLTVGAVGAGVVSLFGLILASALIESQRVEVLRCNTPLELESGTIIVLECEDGGTERVGSSGNNELRP